MLPPALSAGHASAKQLPASHQQQKHARQPSAATHARQPAANIWARWSDIKTASQKLLTVTAAVRGGLLALSVLSKKKGRQRSLFGLEPDKNHLSKYPVLIHAFDSDHEAHSEMQCIRGILAKTTAWLKTHCSHEEFGCKLTAAHIFLFPLAKKYG